jgi:hypothetical protein
MLYNGPVFAVHVIWRRLRDGSVILNERFVRTVAGSTFYYVDINLYELKNVMK